MFVLDERKKRDSILGCCLVVRVKGLEPIRTRHQILSLAWLPITTHPPQKRSRPQMRCGSALSDKYTQNHKTCKMRVRPELPRRYYSSLLLSITIPVILKGAYTSVLPVNVGVLAVFPNTPPAFFLKSWNSISALLHSQYL